MYIVKYTTTNYYDELQHEETCSSLEEVNKTIFYILTQLCDKNIQNLEVFEIKQINNNKLRNYDLIEELMNLNSLIQIKEEKINFINNGKCPTLYNEIEKNKNFWKEEFLKQKQEEYSSLTEEKNKLYSEISELKTKRKEYKIKFNSELK